MALLTLFKKKGETGLFPLNRLKQAKEGDLSERNALIEEYRPFILRVTAEAIGHYVVPGDSDEYSIGLMAFNEAIDSFNEEKGLNFLKFSEQLMKWRLLDYQRKVKRQKDREVSFDTNNEDGESDIDRNPEFGVEEKAFEQLDLRSEILELQKKLQRFGITFSKLSSSAPKHLDSRVLMLQAAKLLAKDEVLMESLYQKGELPVSVLVEKTGLNRKTFYRNRDYIIALALIYNSDLEDIRGHIENMVREVAK